MEVKATAKGYYNLRLQEEGSVFDIKSEKDFSASWMEKVEDERPVKSKKPALKESQPNHALEKAIDGSDVI